MAYFCLRKLTIIDIKIDMNCRKIQSFAQSAILPDTTPRRYPEDKAYTKAQNYLQNEGALDDTQKIGTKKSGHKSPLFAMTIYYIITLLHKFVSRSYFSAFNLL